MHVRFTAAALDVVRKVRAGRRSSHHCALDPHAIERSDHHSRGGLARWRDDQLSLRAGQNERAPRAVGQHAHGPVRDRAPRRRREFHHLLARGRIARDRGSGRWHGPFLEPTGRRSERGCRVHIALESVKERLDREDLTVLAYRFEGDSFCRAARFAAYQQALGDRFQARVLPDSAANPDAPMKNPHSVVTLHLIDEQNQPTRKAVEEIIAFFRMRLL